MIRFSCPGCQKTLKAPANGAGRTVTCPRCGQRMTVPATNSSTTRKAEEDSVGSMDVELILPEVRLMAKSPVTAPTTGSSMIAFACPSCSTAMQLPAQSAGTELACIKCGQRLQVPSPNRAIPAQPLAYPQPNLPELSKAESAFTNLEAADQRQPSELGRPHSGLGIASFLIALLVGGLDIVLTLMVVANVSRARQLFELRQNLLTGTAALLCFNFMSLPLCLVGFGLGWVALSSHRRLNHTYSVIGLLGNGMVIALVIFVIFWSMNQAPEPNPGM